MSEIDETLAAWIPYIEGIHNWQELVKGLEPKETGCGPVYELGNTLPERAPEEFAIADMRNILFAEPHYHPNDETEICVVISGLGKVNMVKKGSIVVTPPNTTHFTVPTGNLVLGVINVPYFNQANYVTITESDPALGFDVQQFTTMVGEAYSEKGLEFRHHIAEAGKVFEPDRDVSMHFLTISGSIQVKLDNKSPRTFKPFQELIVDSGQLHEGKVGQDGWEYLVAWDEDEAKKYRDEHTKE